ncbi:MAG: tRNA (5-methylaminomethyl-2-thiouridine)(34)-methyltransferase MnmD [Caulobacterales bacterium]|jgi:tRNA 5-methylaminomethyl-2-thiouridine biosynthesis bifunctional protein
MPRLPDPPDIDWDDQGRLWDRRYGDIYFSRDDGLAETRLTFLDGCGLPQAWAGRARFAIGELGFGTGLNVLATMQAWRATRPPGGVLSLHSIEAHLLDRADAARALGAFPELADHAAELLAKWPVRCRAPQTLWFERDRVCLTIHQGDAEAVLASLEARFDAWFLDGFAPARNGAMWTSSVFAHLARLSAPGARAATFSSAAAVRDGLAGAGFAVARLAGYGRKRHRLIAQFPGVAAAPAPPRRVAVIGAGIAGAGVTDALIRRGVAVCVYDRAPRIADAASGNPAGLVSLRLDRGPLGPFFLAAYLAAVVRYRALGGGVFASCGLRQLALPAPALADFRADPPLPPDWFRPDTDGVVLSHAGVLNPPAAIAAMLAGADLRLGAAIDPSAIDADAVVIAAGAGLAGFGASAFAPIALSRGQIDWVAGGRHRQALSDGGYVAPFAGGAVYGATFAPSAPGVEPVVTPQDSAANRNVLVRLAADLADQPVAGARAGVRATLPDRLPLCGLCPDTDKWAGVHPQDWAGAAMARRAGLYLLGGFGARGLTFSPLLGEALAAEMCGEPSPLAQGWRAALDPARFLRRALRRHKPDPV